MISAETSYDVWQYLFKTYANPSRARIRVCGSLFLKPQKVTQSITNIISSYIKHLSDQLAATWIIIDDDELALYIFNGVTVENKWITDSLWSRESIVPKELPTLYDPANLLSQGITVSLRSHESTVPRNYWLSTIPWIYHLLRRDPCKTDRLWYSLL